MFSTVRKFARYCWTNNNSDSRGRVAAQDKIRVSAQQAAHLFAILLISLDKQGIIVSLNIKVGRIMLNHTLELRHLGPIDECVLSVKQFTILTGPQSNGKSTIAKAIYFFRTIKQDILNIMMQGGPRAATGNDDSSWCYALEQRMREKFLQLFGTSWVMPKDMEIKYTYNSGFWSRVYLVPDQYDYEKNFIKLEFSSGFQDYFRDLGMHSFANITTGQKKYEEGNLSKKLNDPYETVFIPAGRNLITLLSTQLNYIFTSLESSQLRSIDYTTKRYTELILKLKPMLEHGMVGCLADEESDPERMKRYKKHRNAIELLFRTAQDILQGTYRCVDGEERLYLDERRYIKINFTSSGQQETVWVFNLLFYYLLEDRQVFLILEEPESHLYPSSQKAIAELLALFLNEGNMELITTHSPYILGTINSLLLAGQSGKNEILKKHLNPQFWITPKQTAAYHVQSGKQCRPLQLRKG